MSCIKYQQCGYLLNQVLYTRLLICAELLSKVVSATLVFFEDVTFLPLLAGGTVVTISTVGSSTILNQIVHGLIMVRHMKSILELSCPLRVKGSMRSTHHALQGVVMTSLGGRYPYFWLCLLITWQDLQNLTSLRMVLCIPFQYITDLIIFFKLQVPRVLEVMAIPTDCPVS
jgi:hypothetical protein